jgi:hypothetical protein
MTITSKMRFIIAESQRADWSWSSWFELVVVGTVDVVGNVVEEELVVVDRVDVVELVVVEVVVILSSQNHIGQSMKVLDSVSHPESSHGISHFDEFVGT